jgi:hypothetical protein
VLRRAFGSSSKGAKGGSSKGPKLNKGAFKKLFSLAKPQVRILSAAIGLLFVSSAVTMVRTLLIHVILN